MTYPLFDEWLDRTKKLQIEAFGRDPSLLEGEDRVEFVRWNVLAAQAELIEALDEISWKPWASAEFFNREQFIVEVVDLLHFAANLLVAADCDKDELNEAYSAKMRKNEARQATGYSGTDKCPVCRRAFDDVGRNEGWQICKLCQDLTVEGQNEQN